MKGSTMRRRYLVLAAATVATAAATPSPASAQTGFNGVITFTQHSPSGRAFTFVQTSKGGKVRLDGMDGNQNSMIVNGDAKVMMMIEPEKKQYLTMTEEDMRQSQALMAPMMAKANGKTGKPDPGKFKFSDTGKTETVAGVPCELWRGVYTGQDKQEEGEACVASGVGFALAELTFANPMAGPGQPGSEMFEQYRQLVGGNKGILKVTKIEDGKRVPELEATKIERKSVGDDAFAPPAGYTEVRMGDVMQQARKAMKQAQEQMKQNGSDSAR
jgi:hypothetical protein